MKKKIVIIALIFLTFQFVEAREIGPFTSLYYGKVAWNDNGIYYWDGEKVVNIAEGGMRPSLWDDKIAWSDINDGIQYWDGSKTITLYDKGSYPSNHAGQVSWFHHGSIFFWDGKETIFVIENDDFPVVPQGRPRKKGAFYLKKLN